MMRGAGEVAQVFIRAELGGITKALGGGFFANQAIVGAIVSFPTGFGNSVVGTGKI